MTPTFAARNLRQVIGRQPGFVGSFGGYSTRNRRHIRDRDAVQRFVQAVEGAGPGVRRRLPGSHAGAQLGKSRIRVNTRRLVTYRRE